MAGNKIKVYWIFLLALLYTGVLVMSVGQTQARYESTAVSTTILETDAIGIYSNCMVRAGEPAVTVLLGDLEKNETITVPIKIRCTGEGYSGKLLCGVSDPYNQKYEKYLDLFISPTGQEEEWKEDEEKILTLGMDGQTESIDLTLTIKPTSDATDVIHEMLKINVVVTWGEEMWGTFQVILPEVVEVPKVQEPTDSTEESDDTEVSDDSEENKNLEEKEDSDENLNPDGNDDPDQNTNQEENEDLDEPEFSEPELESLTQLKMLSVADLNDTLPALLKVTNDITSVHLGVLTAENEVGAFPRGTRLSLDGGKSYYMMYLDYAPKFMLEQSTAEETEEPESKDQTREEDNPADQELAEGEENPTEPDLPEGTENPTGQEQAGGEENPVDQALAEEEENPTDQDPPVGTENPTGQDQAGEENPTNQDPPEGTENPAEQDKAEGEENPTVQPPTEGTVPPTEENLPAEEDPDDAQTTTKTLLLLDFSQTNLKNGQELILVMDTYSGTIPIDRALAETTLGATAVLSTNVLPVAETEAGLEEQNQPEKPMQKYSKPILNQDCYLELTAPEAWKELDVDLESETDCILEILTMTDEGSLEYREVSITEETFLVTYTNEEQEEKLEHKLELKLGEKLPQAGTYRLNLNWKYEGVLFKQTQTTFFINYSEHLNRDLSSPEVQTND